MKVSKRLPLLALSSGLGALTGLLPAGATAQDKPPAVQTPAQAAEERKLRRGLPGMWVLPNEGTCRSGAPWIFTAKGTFRSERIEGVWRLAGKRIYLAGFDWALDDKGRRRTTGAWATHWTVVSLTRTRLSMQRKGERRTYLFHRCR